MRHLLLVIWVLGTVALAEHVEPSGQTPMESQKPRPVTESNKQVPKPMTMEEALAKGNTHLLVDPKTHELLSPTGKPFKISVLTEETAEKIFKEMAEQKRIHDEKIRLAELKRIEDEKKYNEERKQREEKEAEEQRKEIERRRIATEKLMEQQKKWLN